MKTPEEMAKEWVKYEFPEGGECCGVSFLAGYRAAKAIVEEEFKIVEERRVTNPGLGGIYYALKIVLAKMGSK